MVLSKGSAKKFGGTCGEERKRKMPKLIKKIGVERLVYISITLFLILLVIEERNVLDFGYLCLFIFYRIRLHLLRRHLH